MDRGVEEYRRYLEGDDSGLSDLVRRYRDGLTLFLTALTGDPFLAEDAVQDTFIRLAVRRPRYTGKSSFKTWLYTIGRNHAVDLVRRRKKLTGDEPDEAALADEARAVEQTCLTNERDRIVHACLTRLRGDYSEALYLKYFEDASNAEIARLTRRSVRQVENLLYKAKAALKKELLREGITNEDL
ncbi:MAG: sigma-70 family RNA polymerase sigma factor [Clostridia bacterium]|nr:sigma-70 family RNA polymerase sigma factor [Clostridia bacterium]